MKILVVCQYYYPEQFRINDICETLVKNGNDVTVLTGLPNYPLGKVPKEYKFFKKRKEIINGVNVIRCFEIGRRKGILFRALNYISYMVSASWKSLFLKKDFDVVYVYQLSPVLMAIPGIVYKKRCKKKLVLYCLDLWPDSMKTFGINEKSRIYKIISKISNKIYNSADKILISSRTFQGNFKDKKIEYLPQYAEDVFIPKKSWENGNFVFAGNIGAAQSVETLIRAANELKDESQIKIHIIGDGSSLAEIKNLSNKLELKNVIFYGKKPVDKMQKYYELADAMIVTLSDDEFASKTLPGKVQACMATGNSIIGVANGETQKIIEEAECGYCVEAEDYKALANIIRKYFFLTNEEKTKMRENSLRFYEENFKKEKVMDKLIKNLMEV